MTNGERADRLLAEAGTVADEMAAALAHRRWNLAVRRAQETVELALKGLLNEAGVEYPRVHDVVPLFVEALNDRQLKADAEFLTWLGAFSRRLVALRAPAFYHELDISEGDALASVDGARRVLEFSRAFLARLRQNP